MTFLMPFFFLVVDSCLGSLESVVEEVPDWLSVEGAAVGELCPELSGAGALLLWPADAAAGADAFPLSAAAAGAVAAGAGAADGVGLPDASAGGAAGATLTAGAGAASEGGAEAGAGCVEVGASMI
jgi:hypothetical protein